MRKGKSRAGWVWGWMVLVAGLTTLGVVAFVEIAAAAPNLRRGAVFVMTNESHGNAIHLFRRAADGRLIAAGVYGTGNGAGARPDSLRSQGSLVRSGDFLFMANTGSNDISVFHIGRKVLTLVDREAARGVAPTSLTVRGGLLYVINALNREISGFRVDPGGQLTFLPGSTRAISGAVPDVALGASQISFTPSGEALLVTVKVPPVFDVFRVGGDGLTDGPFTTPSSGDEPLGFAFDRGGRMVVAETNGGPPDEGSASSYSLAADGTPTLISDRVGSGQLGTGRVVIARNRFAYMTNTASGTISRFRVGSDGSLALQQAVAARTGGSPVDMALSSDERFLYTVVNAMFTGDRGSVVIHRIEADGRLTSIRGVDVPPFCQGIVAF